MAKADREKWAKRVQRWTDAGLSAPEFEAETGPKATSMTTWRLRLKKEQLAGLEGERPAPSIAIARKPATKPLQFVERSDVLRSF